MTLMQRDKLPSIIMQCCVLAAVFSFLVVGSGVLQGGEVAKRWWRQYKAGCLARGRGQTGVHQYVWSWRCWRWCSPAGYGDIGGSLSLSGIAYLQLGIGTFATLQPLPSDLWSKSARQVGICSGHNCTKKTSSEWLVHHADFIHGIFLVFCSILLKCLMIFSSKGPQTSPLSEFNRQQ